MNGDFDPGAVRNLTMTVPPSEEPVTLAQAKTQCRVEIPDDDLLITSQIIGSRVLCEKEAGRAFVARTYLLQLDGFPYCSLAYRTGSLERLSTSGNGLIRLPKPPLISVSSITYIDQTGTTQTLDPSLYLVLAGGILPGSICPAYGTSWPHCRCQPGSVQITYTAGYGAAADVPMPVTLAMLLMVSHLYKNRDAIVDINKVILPFGVSSLLSTVDAGTYP